MAVPLRFHWIFDAAQCARDSAEFNHLCRQAEAAGLESVHIPVDDSIANALALAAEAAAQTSTVKFRFRCDAGRIPPAALARQMRDAASHLGKRLIIHVVLGTAESFTFAAELLSFSRQLFNESDMPEFHVESETAGAAVFAIKHADCLWRRPARPDQVYADALPVLHFGKEVGIVSSVIARATREEAVETAAHLLGSTSAGSSDAGSWITPNLWLGTAPDESGTRAAIAGSFEETARMLHAFRKKGISQFAFNGSPEGEEFFYFAAEVLPLVRALHLTE